MAASAASAGESKDDPILDKIFKVKQIEKTGKQIIDELLKNPVFVDDDFVLREYFNSINVFNDDYDDFLSLYAYYVNRIDEGKINNIDKDRRESSRRESLETKIYNYLHKPLNNNVTTRKRKRNFKNVTGRTNARQKALDKKIYWKQALKRLSEIENSKKRRVQPNVRTVRLRF